jgi:hypothetical protein
MAEEVKTEEVKPQEKLAGKYESREQLQKGLSELAGQVGVSLGKYDTQEDEVTAYSKLSDLARMKREATKPAAPSVLGEKMEEPEPDLSGFFSRTGIDKAKFVSEEPLDDESYQKASADLMKVLSKGGKAARGAIDEFRNAHFRANKAETVALRARLQSKNGLDDAQFDELLAKRNEWIDESKRGVVDRMLTKPQSQDEVEVAFDLVFSAAKNKGFGSTPPVQTTTKIATGGVPSSGAKREITPQEAMTLRNRAMQGDKAAELEFLNSVIKK